MVGKDRRLVDVALAAQAHAARRSAADADDARLAAALARSDAAIRHLRAARASAKAAREDAPGTV